MFSPEGSVVRKMPVAAAVLRMIGASGGRARAQGDNIGNRG